jgi:hypothetical protein
MRQQVTIALVLFLFAGCGGRAAIDLDGADEITLYSIDGRNGPQPEKPDGSTSFLGCPLLGKVVMRDAATIKKLSAAIDDGLAHAPSSELKCFWPRHAIEVIRGTEKMVYLICFECKQYQTYRNGKSEGTKLIDESPQKTLDSVLTSAGIALAPSAFTKE